MFTIIIVIIISIHYTCLYIITIIINVITMIYLEIHKL